MKEYSAIRNYKKFKSEYVNFVLFIKKGDYYYTFDSDAKIMMYVYHDIKDELEYKIEKYRFTSVVTKLHSLGLNVVLAGWKLANEFYTDKTSDYIRVKRLAREYYKATSGSVHYP